MSFSSCRASERDPVALVESCQRALVWLLRSHRGEPLRRCWIDQPYGEEEITRLEQELLPAMEQFLERIGEIDRQLKLEQAAERLRAEEEELPGEWAGGLAHEGLASGRLAGPVAPMAA